MILKQIAEAAARWEHPERFRRIPAQEREADPDAFRRVMAAKIAAVSDPERTPDETNDASAAYQRGVSHVFSA